jgi:hypothetical protein
MKNASKRSQLAIAAHFKTGAGSHRDRHNMPRIQRHEHNEIQDGLDEWTESKKIEDYNKDNNSGTISNKSPTMP